MKKTVSFMLLILMAIAVLAVPADAAETEAKPQLAAVVWDASLQLPIGYLENGAQVTVLEQGNTYFRIDCYDMTGYIRRELVTEDTNGGCYVNCTADAEDVKTVTAQDFQTAMALRQAVCTLALAQEGVPYVYGGTSPAGFDCSGFVQYVFTGCGLDMSRVVTTQLSDGAIIAKEDLRAGDIVVFENTYDTGPSHIGIYLGEGKLIHAGSGGITVVALDSDYFMEHYLCARRVILLETPETPELLMATAAEQALKGCGTDRYW